MRAPRHAERRSLHGVRTRLRAAVLFGSALLVASGCDSATSLGPASAITVVNLTADTIAVKLWERESSYLVDPIPERPAAEEGDRIVYPGGRRQVPTADIPGYGPGKDVQVFVFRIQGSRSRFSAIEGASASSLRRRGYIVEIPASRFQQP
jgi:hypothetical protein